MSYYDDPNPRRPSHKFNEAVEAAYQAGKAAAEAERFATPALSPDFEPSISRRGSGFAEEDHRSLPRRPAIVPPGPGRVRRASTLPVRFEDEVTGRVSEAEEFRAAQSRVSEEEIRRDEELWRLEERARMEERDRRAIMEEELRFEARQRAYLRGQERSRPNVRRGSVDSLEDRENGDQERERLMKGIVVVEEGQGTEAKERKGKGRVSPSLTVSDNDETKDSDSDFNESSSSSGGGTLASEHPRKGKTRMPTKLVSTAALFDLGYPFELEGDSIVILKALGPENINEVIRLSEKYTRGEGFVRPPRGPGLAIPPLPPRVRYHSPPLSPIRPRYDIVDERRSRNRREAAILTAEGLREKERLREYRSRLSPDDPEYDLNDQDVYSFTLSRHRKSLLSRNSTGGSLSDMSETSTAVSSGSIPLPKMNYQVLGSKYTGEGSLGGFQSATLKVSGETKPGVAEIHNPSSVGCKLTCDRFRDTSTDEMRSQFEDISMNLDKFETGSENIAGLTGIQNPQSRGFLAA